MDNTNLKSNGLGFDKVSRPAELLSAENLSCEFMVQGERIHAVKNVSFAIQEGEVLGLVGESGSGKSSIGKLIVGLYQASGGRLNYRGRPMPQGYKKSDFRYFSSRIQMVFQDSQGSLDPRFTIAQSLTEPLVLQAKPKSSHRAAIHHWLENVGLPRSVLNRYPHELSGGQRQRVGIARAFIAEPELVVCDEAISALDVSVQAQIVNLLKRLIESTGVTILFIAHDLAMVRYLCNRCLVMCNGEIVEQGITQQLFDAPQQAYTKRLLAAHPLI